MRPAALPRLRLAVSGFGHGRVCLLKMAIASGCDPRISLGRRSVPTATQVWRIVVLMLVAGVAIEISDDAYDLAAVLGLLVLGVVAAIWDLLGPS